MGIPSGGGDGHGPEEVAVAVESDSIAAVALEAEIGGAVHAAEWQLPADIWHENCKLIIADESKHLNSNHSLA